MENDEKVKLVSITKSSFPEDIYYDHLIKQYEFYWRSLEEHHNRYLNQLKFFVTINTAISSGLAFAITEKIILSNFELIVIGLIITLIRLVATLFISYLSKNSTIQHRLPEYYHTIQNHVFLLGQIKS